MRTVLGEVLGVGIICVALLPTGSKEKGVMGIGSIPVAILPSSQDMKTIALGVFA